MRTFEERQQYLSESKKTIEEETVDSCNQQQISYQNQTKRKSALEILTNPKLRPQRRKSSIGGLISSVLGSDNIKEKRETPEKTSNKPKRLNRNLSVVLDTNTYKNIPSVAQVSC